MASLSPVPVAMLLCPLSSTVWGQLPPLSPFWRARPPGLQDGSLFPRIHAHSFPTVCYTTYTYTYTYTYCTVGAVSLARRRRKIPFFKWLYLKNLLTFLQTVFFILFSMGPSYINNIFSFLSQIVF